MHTFRKQVELRVVCGTMITRCTVLPTICNCTVYTVQCYLQLHSSQCTAHSATYNLQLHSATHKTFEFARKVHEQWCSRPDHLNCGVILHTRQLAIIIFSSYDHLIFSWSSCGHLIIITITIIEVILNCGVIMRARQGPMSGVRENLDRQEGRVCHRRKVGNCIFFKMQYHVIVFILKGIGLYLFFLVRMQRVFFIGPQLYNVLAQIK